MKAIDNNILFPMLKELIEQGKTVQIVVSGSSMNPFLIHHRDLVLVKSLEGNLKSGDIALYQRENGAYVLHRVHHVDSEGKLYMIGDAQTEIEGPLDVDCVFGIVCKVRRKGRWMTAESFWWKFFEKVWIRLVPFRRWIMGMYRIITRR